VGAGLRNPPAIFHVNWFRTNAEGRFVWPGFGQNLRVLLWMIDRVKGKAEGTDTPLGVVPRAADLNWDGLDLSPADRDLLLKVDRAEWEEEVPEIRAFFDKLGNRLPPSLDASLEGLAAQLATAAV
jgi:phosphoenolpyruvate carboxykinase (GTP)